MRSLLFLVSFLCSMTLWGQSQNHEFTIDYTVKYVIDNAKKGAKDTITVGFEKNGKYLWSDYKGLAQEFAGEILPSIKDIPDGAAHFVYSSEQGKFLIGLYLGSLNMIMDMDIQLIMSETTTQDDAFDEVVVLESRQTSRTYDMNGDIFPVYEIYPDIENKSIIKLALDESKAMDNNNLFQSFFQLMLTSTNSKGDIQGQIPDGLILSIIDQSDNVLLRAISVDDTPLKISINNSFKISE